MIETMGNYKKEVNSSLASQDAKIKQFHAYKTNIATQIDAAKSHMTAHWDACTE